jgi:hypothetical protein
VITFTDITVAKTLEAQLREKHDVLEKQFSKQSPRLEKAKDPPCETGGGDATGQAAMVVSRGKAAAETGERKRIKYRVEEPAASDKR